MLTKGSCVCTDPIIGSPKKISREDVHGLLLGIRGVRVTFPMAKGSEMAMDDDRIHFFNDDGVEIRPDLT